MKDKKQKDLKIIFMGTSPFAKTVLESLVETKYDIVSVFTRPDKKSGRDQSVRGSAVKEFARSKNLEISTPEKLDTDAIKNIKEKKPDLIIVVAYGKILPKAILEIPCYGALNIHGSLLPKYRGPSPIQNAILNGETETGITIIKMDVGVDTGEILVKKEIRIKPDELAPDLSNRLADLAAQAILETIRAWTGSQIKSQKQDEKQASYCQLIERNDGQIIWNESAENIYNKYRALYPWPGIFTFWQKHNTPKRLKLVKIRILEDKGERQRHIGEVFQEKKNIAVQTSSGAVILEMLQLEGKASSAVKEFINGYPDFIGSILK